MTAPTDKLSPPAVPSLDERVAKLRRDCMIGNDVPDERRDLLIVDLHSALQATVAQLPNGMKHCTIQFKECSKGHGWLTATNWVQHDCPTCALQAKEVECEQVQAKYDELIFAVASKYPAETRHQTALRYINTVEEAGRLGTGCAAGPGGPKLCAVCGGAGDVGVHPDDRPCHHCKGTGVQP